MIGEFISTQAVLVGLWTVMCIFLLVLLLKSNIRSYLKVLIIPLTFALLYFTIIETTEMIGNPIVGIPQDEFLINHYKIGVEDGRKYIYVWIRTKEDEEKLYRFDYNEQKKKALKDAEKRYKTRGIPQMGQMVNTRAEKRKGQEQTQVELKTYDYDFSKMFPKPEPKD